MRPRPAIGRRPVPAARVSRADLHRRPPPHAEDRTTLDGTSDRDAHKTLRVGQVPMPEPAVDEVLIAVMASSINQHGLVGDLRTPADLVGGCLLGRGQRVRVSAEAVAEHRVVPVGDVTAAL